MSANLEKPKQQCVAFLAEADGQNIVGIGNLRVVFLNDAGHWFAQALEIDYLAEGKTLDLAKKNFEEGLKATITLNLQTCGGIENMLKLAPPEVWKETIFFPGAKMKRFSHISMHDILDQSEDEGVFPFKGVDYLVPEEALAAASGV